MATPKIAIIGAGPAGCMLARLLHIADIPCTVFEGESSPNYRSQGGTLDLHTTTGLAAMKAAGLWDNFMQHARYDGQYMAIVDKSLSYHFLRRADNAGANALEERPEIDRAELRKLLVESLPEGVIRWGHRLKSVDSDTNALVFEHTTETGFDLVIGADGAWSKVRRLIDPETKPKYVGIGMHDLAIPNVAETAPQVSKLINRGSVFAYSDGKRICIQQMGDGSAGVYVDAVREKEEWMKPENCGYDAHDLTATRAALLQEFSDWCPQLKEAIVKSQGKCIPRSLYMLPVGYRWTHRKGATILGDAAHLMTPFAGEGVNTAFEDAMSLATHIIAARDEGFSNESLDKHVAVFEKEMFPRMKRVQELTDGDTRDWMWTPGAPGSVIASMMARHVRFQTPTMLHPLVTVGVYSFVWAYGLARWMGLAGGAITVT